MITGTSVLDCCQDIKLAPVKEIVPTVKTVESDLEGFLTVKFREKMIFGDEWIKAINATGQEMLKVSYLNGYPKEFDEF